MKLFLKSAYALAISVIMFGCSSQVAQTPPDYPEYPKAPQAVSAHPDGWFNPDTVKAGKFDTGTMWTFEYAPVEYFNSTYKFKPTQEWLDDTRMSALRFATYCSASFVSEDGLVMTNNHCGRQSITEVTKEGESLMDEGFFAKTLADERKVEGLFVEQLEVIQDVTAEVQQAIDKGTTDQEKAAAIATIKKEITTREAAKTGLRYQVVTLYQGGKYSLYGYRRYDDVRLVFSPEHQLGYFGGDYDNFTYPRYNMDCTFFRVYKDGKPLKTKNFFKWSPNGAKAGEPVFVVGNPGSTSRLNTMAQLEFNRDISYPRTIELLNSNIAIYEAKIKQNPKNKEELNNTLLSYTNSHKAISGMLGGLRDPYLMAKKQDFENSFKKAIKAKSDLQAKYGNTWDHINSIKAEQKAISNELFAYMVNPFTSSTHFVAAQTVLQMPNADSLLPEVYAEFDADVELQKLAAQINRMYSYLGKDNKALAAATNGKRGLDAARYMVENSNFATLEKAQAFAKKGGEEFSKTDDPFIKFLISSAERKTELQTKMQQLGAQETANSQLLGRAIYDVYGTSIPPDATFTLRISDGIVDGYSYNGTIAPPVTTFYGMYDRYYSFGKEEPFNLPKKWQNPPKEFNLETPFNFISTNDIIGGNSGSPIINTKGEIIGLAFDGNIESLPGNFIFDVTANRCVGVHSEGMIEAIQDLYQAKRLSKELDAGKIVE